MMTTMKAYACNTVKIYEKKPQKFQIGGRAGPGSAFDDFLTKKIRGTLQVSGQYRTSCSRDVLRGLVPGIWRFLLLYRVMMMTIHRQLTVPDTISHSFLRVWSLPMQVNKYTGKPIHRSTVYR